MSRHVRLPDYTTILSEVLAVHGFILVSISLHLILTLTHLLIHTGKASIQPKLRSQCTPTNPTVKWAPLPKSRSSWPYLQATKRQLSEAISLPVSISRSKIFCNLILQKFFQYIILYISNTSFLATLHGPKVCAHHAVADGRFEFLRRRKSVACTIAHSC